jgi:hypothetical protein
MRAGRIPVVTVKRGGAVGTPEDFEARYDKIRKKGSGRVTQPTRQPKLKPLENPSMMDRMADFGIQED